MSAAGLKDLAGKVAVVTGGGGGLGLALARQCAARGMRLLLADLDPAALARSKAALGPAVECVTEVVDVTRAEDLERLARVAYERFGAVHLLFNNAGVALVKTVAETTVKDWRWVLDVDLWGVLHGIAAFLPRMQRGGQPGRIVNTASAAGVVTSPGMAAYNVAKHGVVVVSEVLAQELALAKSPLGVTVLCPAFFPTGINESERNRPAALADDAPAPESQALKAQLDSAVRRGRLTADDVAAQALAAVEAGELYLFTHKKLRLDIERRFQGILDACPYQDTPSR